MKNKYIITLLNLILVIGVIAFLGVYVNQQSEKQSVVYVDNIKLFNGYNMAKDLSATHTKKITVQRKKVDSIYQEFQRYVQLKDEVLIQKTQQLLQKEDQALSAMQEYFKKEVSQQVWKRINASLKTYGEANDYVLILGANGNGSVMYANEAAVDVTNSFLEYANSKYEGE